MRRKKVLIGLTYYRPNISGLTLYVEKLSQELAKNSKITIVTSRYKQEYVSGKEGEVDVVRVDGVSIGKGFLMPFLFFKLARLVKDNDVVNYHLPSMEAPLAAWWCKIWRKKFILTYHCYFESGNKLINKLIEWWHNIACYWADIIVVNTIDYVQNYGILKQFRDKMVEIYPPISTESKKQNIKNKNSKFIIGYLGRLSKEKNLEILFEAIPYLRQEYKNSFQVKLAGPRSTIGEDAYKIYIEKLIAKNEDVVIDTGQVENVNDFFEQIDCLVLPSNNSLESFGMVSAEAINYGIPVVCSNIPGVRVPVMISGMGELFDPNNPIDLAKKIIKVMTTKYSQRKFFDIKETVNSYEKILNDKV